MKVRKDEMNKSSRVHVSLNVSDVSRSIEFYSRMFGLPPVRVRDDYAKFDVPEASLNLALNASATAVADGGRLSHLGLQVDSTDDVLAMRLGWQERGLLTRDEMATSCCYAKQDKTWITDPDGNEWEVFVVLGEVEQAAPSTGTCCVA